MQVSRKSVLSWGEISAKALRCRVGAPADIVTEQSEHKGEWQTCVEKRQGAAHAL